MGWFDSDYETYPSWDSVRLLTDTGEQYHRTVIDAANGKNSDNQAGFYTNYAAQVMPIKQSLRQAYHYTKNGVYPQGIPDIRLSTANASAGSLESSIRTEFGLGGESITTTAKYFGDVPPEVYYGGEFAYNSVDHPDGDMDFLTGNVTYPDDNNTVHVDWGFDSIIDRGNGTHDITLVRSVDALTYWVEGPDYIVEGQTEQYTIRLNRILASGKTMVFDFDMTGDGVSGVDYTTPAQVTINAGEDRATFSFTVLDNSVDVDHVIQMGLILVSGEDSYTQVQPRSGLETTTISVLDRNNTTLTMPHLLVTEEVGTVGIPIKLENPAASPFTVIAYTITESAIAGDDFTHTETVLNFSGASGEVVQFDVPLLTDPDSPVDDDFASFRVAFKDCSDPDVDTLFVGKVTITDNTNPNPPTYDYIYLAMNLPSPPVEDGYYVLFTHASASPTGKNEQFLYYPSTGSYPALDDGAVSTTLNDASFPVFDLRKDHKDIDNGDFQELYQKSRLVMGQMNLNVDDMISAYRDDPEAGSMDEAYINLRVPVGENNHAVSAALFQQMYDYAVSNGLHLSDYEGTIKRVRQKSDDYTHWGQINFYEDEELVITSENRYTHSEGTYAGGTPSTSNPSYAYRGVNLVIYFQKTATHCDVIEVLGLYNKVLVDPTSWLDDADVEWVYKTSWDNVTLPMTWATINNIPPFSMTELVPYIYRLDITSAVVVETKWYQKSWFKVLLNIVRVIIMIFLPGVGNIIDFLLQLLIQYLIAAALQYLLRALGVDPIIIAAIAAVAAVVAGNYMSGTTTNFLDAETLTQLSSNFAKYMNEAAEALGAELKDEMDSFNEEYDNRMEDIEEAKQQLSMGSGVLLGPSAMVAMALESNYQYDLLFDYDRLLTNYHSNEFRLGIV